MSKLKNAIIKALGGYTREQYMQEQHEKNATKEAWQSIRHFLQVPVINARMEGKVLRLTVATERILLPAREIERRIAEEMVRELVSRQIIAQRVKDEDGKLLIMATLNVLVPESYANQIGDR